MDFLVRVVFGKVTEMTEKRFYPFPVTVPMGGCAVLFIFSFIFWWRDVIFHNVFQT